MRKIIVITIAALLASFNLFSQENDTVLKRLLAASVNDTYLKDFPFELNAKSTTSFKVVLSKNTIYRLFFYHEVENELIYKIDKNDDNNVQGGNINAQPGITYVDIILPETAVYFIKIKNLTNSKIKSNCLLTFHDKTTETPVEIEFVGVGVENDNEEIFTITSQETNNSQVEQFHKKEEPDEIFFIVEQMPTFNGGGSEKFRNFLRENIKYPQQAIDNKIEGRVYAQFVVDKNGYIRDAKVVRGVHPSLDQEALRVIYSSPKWEPGTQRGIPVNVSYTFPIIFKLP